MTMNLLLRRGEIRIGRERLQSLIDASVPMNHTIHGVIVHLKEARIGFLPGRITQALVVAVEVGGFSTRATITASCIPAYREGSLYADDVQVSSITIDDVQTPMAQLGTYGAALTGMLGKTSLGQKVGGFVADSRIQMEGKVVAIVQPLVRMLFANIALYKLDTSLTKERLAHMMLGSIRVEGDDLVLAVKTSMALVYAGVAGLAVLGGAAWAALHFGIF